MVLELPAPKCALHLYRHLLREVSYLPPVIRACFTERIKVMYRRHRNDSEPQARLRKANQKLRNIRAAVSGDRERLYKLISSAFGREGFRRRQLLADFLEPEDPVDQDELQKLVDWKSGKAPAPKGSRRKGQDRLLPDWLDGWDKPKLMALLKQQGLASGVKRANTVIKSTNLDPTRDVPELNAWGLPTPAKPARTKEKKWWKNMADKVLPPLPRGEWELLGKLAEGESDAGWAVQPRRKVASGASAQDEQGRLALQRWDMEGYILHPACWVDRKSSRKRVLLTGISQPNDELGHFRRGSGSKSETSGSLSPRSLKRIYQKVWRETPLMQKTPTKAGPTWKFTYGEPRSRDKSIENCALVFQGVDTEGISTNS